MTRLELAKVLNNIMLNNRFSIIERDNCHSKYESQIISMQQIFELQKQTDFTYLYAVSELLSDDYKKINSFLLDENKDSPFIQKIKEPTRADKLLVATAFEENLEFFSMAWNWVSIATAEIAEISRNNNIDKNIIQISNLFEVQAFDCDIYELPAAAATTKTDNLTYIDVEPLGKLQVQGNDGDDPCITVVVFLKPEYQSLKFELNVLIEINGEEHVFIIKKDNEDTESDKPALNPWFINYSNGFKIKSIVWKPIK